MAFCRNCGQQMADELNNCPNCGALNGMVSQNYNQQNFYQNRGADFVQLTKKKSIVDVFGNTLGIPLFIVAVVNMMSDTPILEIFLSAFLIVACLFCLTKKYKLKLFTILALIIAALSLMLGINKAKSDGLFGNRDKEDTSVSVSYIYVPETSVSEVEKTEVSDMTTEISESVDETSTEDETSVEEEVTSTEDKIEEPKEEEIREEKHTGLDPDFKAFMDSYEAFMDEYIDFIKKYNEAGNPASMMLDYSKIMLKYADFADKVEAYDTEEMSDEDLKYYLDVTTRVEKKMLELY